MARGERSGSVDTTTRPTTAAVPADQYPLFLDFVIAVKTIGSLFVSKQSS